MSLLVALGTLGLSLAAAAVANSPANEAGNVQELTESLDQLRVTGPHRLPERSLHERPARR